MTALSVISSFRQAGSSPVVGQHLARSRPRRPGSRSWRAERLTLDDERLARPLALPARRLRGRPPRSTQLADRDDQAGLLGDRDEARPGAIRPRSGCSQRSSASTAADAPGLERRRSAGRPREARSRSMASRRSVSSSSRSQRSARHARGRRARSGPCRSPWRGTSPGRRRAAGRRPVARPGALSAMPMLTLDDHLAAVEQERRAAAAPAMRSATATARRPRRRRPRAAPRTRRRRAARPCPRRAGSARSRSATAISSSSPASWPEAVVDHLEVVQVQEQHRDQRARSRRPGAAPAPAGRGTAARFGRPVSASWKARLRYWS